MEEEFFITTIKGVKIRIDPDIYERVKDKRWNFAPRNGRPRASVRRNVYVSLTKIILGLSIRGQALKFKNGDELDYRRDNLLIVSKHHENKIVKKHAENSYAIEDCPMGIKKIVKTSKERRPAFCRDDKTCHRDKYWRCLSIAAEENWPGWRGIK